jgi:uncharacterized protein with HEPN domain
LRDDRERLADILEAIDRAQRYAVQGWTAYERADLALVWSVVENDLPGLRKAVIDLLDERI